MSHRRFGRQTLGAGFAKVVAALGTGVSVILPSLMMGIDQRIIAERCETFGEAIDGALLGSSEHFLRGLLAGSLTDIVYPIKDIGLNRSAVGDMARWDTKDKAEDSDLQQQVPALLYIPLLLQFFYPVLLILADGGGKRHRAWHKDVSERDNEHLSGR